MATERFPRVGGQLLKLQTPPAHERAWATGAAIVLHDRRMPRSRANIDHLAVAPSGVFVIDAKRYRGKIEIRKRRLGEEKLLIAGRDKTRLADSLAHQAEAVRAALAGLGSTAPVQPCFCFLNPSGQSGGSGIPLMRTLEVREIPLYYPRKLAKRLNQPGPIGTEEARLLAAQLGEAFPEA